MDQHEVMKAINAIEFHLVFLNPRLTPDFQEKNEAVMALAKQLREHLEIKKVVLGDMGKMMDEDDEQRLKDAKNET